MLILYKISVGKLIHKCTILCPELPVSSPLIHGILRVVSQWQEILKEELESKGPPPIDYIPGCFVEQATTGPPINKYRTLLDKSNTPFQLVYY